MTAFFKPFMFLPLVPIPEVQIGFATPENNHNKNTFHLSFYMALYFRS